MNFENAAAVKEGLIDQIGKQGSDRKRSKGKTSRPGLSEFESDADVAKDEHLRGFLGLLPRSRALPFERFLLVSELHFVEQAFVSADALKVISRVGFTGSS
jgi:hypothetical protein